MCIVNCFEAGNDQCGEAKPGNALKGALPSLGKSTIAFCALFSCVLLMSYCKSIDICVGCGGNYGYSLCIFFVCCSRPVQKALIFLSVIFGITATSQAGNNNERKLGQTMCLKARRPALAEALLPSTLFLLGKQIHGLGDALECVCSHSTNNFSFQTSLFICELCNSDEF